MRIYNAIVIALFMTTTAISQEIYSINDLFDYQLNSCEYRKLENGQVDPVEKTYAPNTRVIYTCDDGFTLMGASFASCSQGSWSAILPYCAETYRPTPPPATCPYRSLPNGRVISTTSTSTTYQVGDKVGFSCNTGYKRIGAAISECLENGIWGSAVPICQKIVPKGCNYRQLVSGSSFPKKDSYNEREVVVYECAKGHALKGTSAAACFGGKWTTELPSCEEENKECQYRELANGETKPKKSVYENFAVVLYQCDENYELTGARGAACVNGVWSDNLPYCERKEIFSEPEIYCATPKFLRGELYPTTSDSRGYPAGAILAFLCNTDHYYRKGSHTAKCLENGKWNQIPTCEVGCKKPVIENGYYETDGELMSNLYYEQGQQVLFHCNPTYKISGEISATCKKNGRWSVKLPTCEKWVIKIVEKGCPPPVFPAGTYTPTLAASKTVYSVGDRVVFSCNDEHHAKGKNHATCLTSGKWTRFPTCTDECIPPNVVHGKVKSLTGSFKYTSQITLKCNAGYIAIGATQATCLRGGVWSAQLRCSDGCYAPKIAHMQIQPTPVNGGNAYEFGHRIRFKCDLGFSTTVAEAECRGKNKWDKALPKCSLLSSNPTSGCRLPKLSAGLVLKNQKQSVYSFKTQFEFKCEKGYNMIGSAVSICRKHNGGRITGRLDPLPPTCQPQQCGSPGKPQNGRFRDGQKNAYYVGDVVHFVCDDRYVMTGSSSITCQANGQFSGLAPKCAPPSCKEACDFVLRRECQCDIKCGDRGDCCFDFDQLCRHLFY